MIIYVYQDIDNNELEIFKTLKEAKEFHKEVWASDDDEEWSKFVHDQSSPEDNDYVTIYKKEIE